MARHGAGQTYNPLVEFDLAGQANGRRPYWDWQYKNFAPRFAFAYSPGSSGKTSIRGGFGIYYDHFGMGIVNSFDRNGSFGLTTALSNSAGLLTPDTAPRFSGLNELPPSLILPAPVGGFPYTPPFTATTGGVAITWGLDNKIKTPYAEVFNLSLTHELPKNFVIEGSYIGRLGHHLMQEDDMAMPLNIRDPRSGMDYFTAATMLTQAFENNVPLTSIGPIAYWENMFPGAAGVFSSVGSGCAPGSESVGGGTSLSATQAMCDFFTCYPHNESSPLEYIDVPGAYTGENNCFPAADCSILGPNAFYSQQFSSLYAWRSIGNSSYNAAQFSLRHKGNGLQFDFNYTLSKSLDVGSNAERINEFEGFGFASQIINAWAPKQLRAVSDFDTLHQINANFVWDVPVGRGRHFGASWTGFPDHLLGGWMLSGVYRWTSGYPFSVAPGLGFWPTNFELTSSSFLKPGVKSPETGAFIDQDGDPNVWRDPAVADESFRFSYPGESGQRNNFRGPGFFGIDMGLAKVWKLTERQDLKFSWEVFNITNSVRFDVGSLQNVGNNSVASALSFGKYTQTLTKPRIMQFALRYSF